MNRYSVPKCINISETRRKLASHRSSKPRTIYSIHLPSTMCCSLVVPGLTEAPNDTVCRIVLLCTSDELNGSVVFVGPCVEHQVLWTGIWSRCKQTTGAVRLVRLHGIRFGCCECTLFLNIPTVLR